MSKLSELSLSAFTAELANTRFPTPAGGAACGAALAMAAGLWEMCCELTGRKHAPYRELWEERARMALLVREAGLMLVQADTDAYERVIRAGKQRRKSPENWRLAVRGATDTLVSLGEQALSLLQQIERSRNDTIPPVQGDLMTAAALASACLESACYSVGINSGMTGEVQWEHEMNDRARDLDSRRRALIAAISLDTD